MIHKKYNFNLSLPQEKRWLPILQDFESEKSFLQKQIDSVISDLLPNDAVLSLVRFMMNRYASHIMYLGEMKSIADWSGVPVEKIFLLQVCYEACAYCTTLVTECEAPIFVRFMDWDLDWLKNFTIQLVVTKEDQILFEAPTWLGCVGMFTVFNRSKGLGAAINFRRVGSRFGLLGNIYRLWKMDWPASYLLRDCFESGCEGKELISRLTRSPLVAPCYFTIFNAQLLEQSMVITKGSNDNNEVQIRYFDRDQGFLAQTNCDDGKTEPNILFSVERSQYIKDLFEKQSNPIRRDDLIQQLLHEPILNHETVYYCIMDQNECQTFLPTEKKIEK